MNKNETRKAAEVMLAWASGKEIEARPRIEGAEWYRVETPLWDWPVTEYRIKPEPREFWLDLNNGRAMAIVEAFAPPSYCIRVREVLDND